MLNSMNNIQKKQLEKYGISPENIPNTFFQEFVSFDLTVIERDYLRNIGSSYTSAKLMEYEKVCIKDVVGTTHPKYRNKSIIEAYTILKRGDVIIKCQRENPEYYTVTLKDKNRPLNDEITLVKRNGKYYITQGNNRLINQLVNYLAEKEHIGNDAELLSELDDKYTFLLKCAIIPEQKEEMVLINFLKKVNPDIKISKSNITGEMYDIILDNRNIKIASLDDIKKLISQMCELRNFKNGKEIENIFDIFLSEYYQESSFKESMNNLEITNKFIKLQDQRTKKFNQYNELLLSIENSIEFDELISIMEAKKSDLFVYLFQLITNSSKDNFSTNILKVNDLILSLAKEEQKEINDLLASKKSLMLNEVKDNKKIEEINNFFEDFQNHRIIIEKQELIALLNVSVNYEYLADKILLEDPDVSNVLWQKIAANRQKRFNMNQVQDKTEFMKLLQSDIYYFMIGSEELRNDDEIIKLVLSINPKLFAFINQEKQEKYTKILYPDSLEVQTGYKF